MTMGAMSEDVRLEPIVRLRRDIKKSAEVLTDREARYLVDLYYSTQESRIRAAAQVRDAAKGDEPHGVTAWVFDQFEAVESGVKGALGAYAKSREEGRWALSIHGIGPVIAAGLLAHIDIHRAPTVGHIWRFAGLDPTVKWEKGTKRPWNAALKVLCWKIGQSFMKLRGSDNDIYGQVYEARKKLEVERNERGDFAAQAAATLEAKKIRDKDTRATYEAGKLPAGRLELRAERYAVKLFLAHYHHVAHEIHFGAPPPKPYVIEHLGHAHFIAPPNWPL